LPRQREKMTASKGFIVFMMGMTGAGLFGRVRRPGPPTEFIDSRTVKEYLAGGEFEETLTRFRNRVHPRPINQINSGPTRGQ
jgi:hypothetical protein